MITLTLVFGSTESKRGRPAEWFYDRLVGRRAIRSSTATFQVVIRVGSLRDPADGVLGAMLWRQNSNSCMLFTRPYPHWLWRALFRTRIPDTRRLRKLGDVRTERKLVKIFRAKFAQYLLAETSSTRSSSSWAGIGTFRARGEPTS